MSVKDLKAAVEDVLLNKNGSKLSTADRDALSKAVDGIAKGSEWARYAVEQIEERWLERVKMQDYGKPASQKYRKAELEFFVGAMTAINALLPGESAEQLSPYVPTRWVINPISGRLICG